tara:strand:- start:2262 stop:3518 length:1257 start_codon:yes stop_codon:yes gene_type:complete
MRSNYKKLGQFIRVVDVRNKEGREDNLLGVSTRKVFIDSVANTVGTDFKKYKIVKKNQFTYVPDTSRRGDKIGIAMLESLDQALVSQAYTVFEVSDKEQLDPEYLMMWFRRTEFDRYARFKSHGSVREIFDWEEMCDTELPVPSIEKQREIVREYNVVNDRIALNEQLTQKLEDTAQAVYKQWFVDFEFPMTKVYAKSIGKPELEGKPYKSFGGKFEYSELLEKDIPSIWSAGVIPDLGNVVGGATPSTFSENYWGGSISWLSPKDISKNGEKFVNNTEKSITELGFSKSSTVMLPKHSVLFTSRAPVGLIAINTIELCTNQGFKSVIPRSDFYLEYLYFYLKNNTDYISGQGSGTTFTEVSGAVMKQCKALIPGDLTLNSFSLITRKLFSIQLENERKNKVLKELVSLIRSKLAGGL